MAQRDPLVEYQREGYDMFVGMLEALKEESVGFLFNVQVEAAPQQPQVAPQAPPPTLSEFAAAAAAKASDSAAKPDSGSVATKDARRPSVPLRRCAPRGSTTRRRR